MKNFIFTICCLCAPILFVNSTFGCTLAGKPLSDFDETEYIFFGEVIGYTKSVKSEKLGNYAYGLVVKVKERVFLPKTPKTHFEIFPIKLWSDCSEGGTNIEELKKDFPLNSEIRVITKESEILPNLSDGNIRLEDRPREFGSIVLNYDKNQKRMTSADSVFDYKSFKYDINEIFPSKYLLPNFEIRKDLLRLKNSQSQNERINILSRLRNAPDCCSDLDFQAVFDKYNSANK